MQLGRGKTHIFIATLLGCSLVYVSNTVLERRTLFGGRTQTQTQKETKANTYLEKHAQNLFQSCAIWTENWFWISVNIVLNTKLMLVTISTRTMKFERLEFIILTLKKLHVACFPKTTLIWEGAWESFSLPS